MWNRSGDHGPHMRTPRPVASGALSGQVAAASLAPAIAALPRRTITYRLLLAPGPLGSLVYVSRHRAYPRGKVEAGG